MSLSSALAALLLVALGGWVAVRSLSRGWTERIERTLRRSLTAWALGLATALSLVWVAGGTLDVEPISTDEAAYLLQAKIFARGAAAAPAPPIPEFFEQAWVNVSPKLFAKYPPGHALILAPGVAIGWPWLVPFLLNLAGGALLYLLMLRAVGPAAALLTWGAWTLSGMTNAWHSTYLSQVTLFPCWLGAVYCGQRWTDGGRRGWLLAAAALLGLGALTRPLSIILLSLPFAVAAFRIARAQRRTADLVPAFAVAAACLLMIPAWNLATTGIVTRSPLREYTETYLPWDRLGFAIESTSARRPPPPDLEGIAPHLVRVHREHTVTRLPQTMLERGTALYRLLFRGWRGLLLLLLIPGLFLLRGADRLFVAAGASLFLGHAVWAHEAGWTVYYAESTAVWFLPGVVAVVAGLRWTSVRLARDAHEARVAAAAVLVTPALLLFSFDESRPYREWRERRAADSRALTEMVASGPGHGIYFIRYGALTSGRPGLVRNDPWLATARDWIVYDLGARNEELRRLAPDRSAFLVDVAGRTVTPLPPLPPTP